MPVAGQGPEGRRSPGRGAALPKTGATNGRESSSSRRVFKGFAGVCLISRPIRSLYRLDPL